VSGYAERTSGEDTSELEALICRIAWQMEDGEERKNIAVLPLAGGIRRVDKSRCIVLAPHGLHRPFRLWNAGRVTFTVDAERPAWAMVRK
jgi:hypothetical protein